jgi:DNA-binding LytR/AlgR family response regulator
MSAHPVQRIACIIVDDEPLAQEVIAAHIAAIPQLELVQRCNNAMEAFEALHKHTIDLLFLDINMPVINGLSFLRSLKDPPVVILTTAYTEYAMDGYELDVADYLLKPIPFDRFSKAVTKAGKRLQQIGRHALADWTAAPAAAPVMPMVGSATPAAAPAADKAEKDYFFIKADGRLVKLNYADVRFIEGMKDYLKIYTATHTYVVHQTMKGMEEQLPAGLFFRVHKSYIVALDAIQSIEGNLINLEKAQVPLGSSYRDALLEFVAGRD